MATRAAPVVTGVRHDASSWRLGAGAPWLWALGSTVLYVAAAYLTLPLVTLLPAQFLLQPLVWGGAVLGGALLLGRLIFSRWLHVSLAAVALAVVGMALAGLLEESLHAWAIERFATFNWQLIGPTYGLFAVIVGSAAAGFGVLVAPRRATLPPLIIAVGAALLSGLVVAVNLPGLGDGINVESVAPALLVAAGGGYALVVAFIGVMVAVRRELSDEPPTPR